MTTPVQSWKYVGTTPMYTARFTGNFTTTTSYTGIQNWGNNLSFATWQPPSKIKNGKYRVRCRSCAQWAKVIGEKGPTLIVNCKRCLGENEGFII